MSIFAHQLDQYSLESVARLSTVYQNLSTEEQDYFLVRNGLIRKQNKAITDEPASNSHQSRIRAAEVSRLVKDNNQMLEDHRGYPMFVPTTLPRTEEDIKLWFDSLDEEKSGTISKESFRKNVFGVLEDFGAPLRPQQLEEQLAKMKSVEDRLTFHEFMVLVLHYVKHV
mmetsp:Transcript_46860/g.54305  ORF Transcript_46860/g.54305 Transcript_46860/m.54305 type:complete len:169 (+) Transcript_46860:57-563(+)